MLSTFDKHGKTQRVAKLKNSVGGDQSHLKFSKIYGGSEPHLNKISERKRFGETVKLS